MGPEEWTAIFVAPINLRILILTYIPRLKEVDLYENIGNSSSSKQVLSLGLFNFGSSERTLSLLSSLLANGGTVIRDMVYAVNPNLKRDQKQQQVQLKEERAVTAPGSSRSKRRAHSPAEIFLHSPPYQGC